MAKTTLLDVAEKAGVSISTVSRVLNGSALISDDQATRIRRVAYDLGYKKRTIRKPLARSILNVMIVLPKHGERAIQLFYDYSELLNGISQAIPTDRANLFTSIDQKDLLRRDYKKGGALDAVIFAFTQPGTKVEAMLREKSIPFLVLNRVIDSMDYVTCDHVQGMRSMVKTVMARRPSANPCFLDLQTAAAVSDLRREGFLDGARQASLSSPDERVIPIDSVIAMDAEFVESVKSRGFDVIMCFNDVVAIAFMELAKSLGLKIPSDMGVTGFDHAPMRDLILPRLDTVSMEVERLGHLAGEWLLERVINREAAPWQRMVVGQPIPGDTL